MLYFGNKIRPCKKTTEYVTTPKNTVDLRALIHPKREPHIKFRTYTQVFSDKHGFIPNLSILDLIFL